MTQVKVFCMTIAKCFIAAVLPFDLAPYTYAIDAAGSADPSERHIADIIDIAPWGYTGIDGKPAGVYPNFFQRLSQRSGCTLEPRITPIPRAILEVSRGSASATMMLDRADLNESAFSLGEVMALHIEVWLPPGSPLRGIDDLAGKSVGVLRGPTYHEGFERDSRIVKPQVTNPRQQLEMLIKGRLDGAIGVRENFLTAASQMGLPLSAFGTPINLGKRVVKLWIAPGLKQSPCAKRWSQSLKEMRQSGEVENSSRRR